MIQTRAIVLLIFFLLTLVKCFSQIPNNGFEQWATINSYEDPLGWSTLNRVVASASVQSVIKLFPGNPGSYYLSAKTVSVSGKGLVPGRVVSGRIDTVSYKPLSGFPFTSRPAQLNYNMQYMVALPGDTAFVSVLLSKWNLTLQKRDTVAVGVSRFNAMAHQWFSNSTILNYLSGDNPDSALIVISSSSVAAMKDSYIYIDNLSFSGTVIGVNEAILSDNSLVIFPNPFIDQLNVYFEDMPTEKPANIFVYNSFGALIFVQIFAFSSRIINTAEWDKGIYTIQIRNEGRRFVKKIIK